MWYGIDINMVSGFMWYDIEMNMNMKWNMILKLNSFKFSRWMYEIFNMKFDFFGFIYEGYKIYLLRILGPYISIE